MREIMKYNSSLCTLSSLLQLISVKRGGKAKKECNPKAENSDGTEVLSDRTRARSGNRKKNLKVGFLVVMDSLSNIKLAAFAHSFSSLLEKYSYLSRTCTTLYFWFVNTLLSWVLRYTFTVVIRSP